MGLFPYFFGSVVDECLFFECLIICRFFISLMLLFLFVCFLVWCVCVCAGMCTSSLSSVYIPVCASLFLVLSSLSLSGSLAAAGV